MIERLSRHIVEADTGCWMWTGHHDRRGYGRAYDGERTRLAHRVVWQAMRGPIPNGLTLDHLCSVPGCVNPDHLEPVTHAENVKRAADRDRKSHCPRGHAFDEANTYVGPGGYRKCRTCRRDDMNRRYREKIACT